MNAESELSSTASIADIGDIVLPELSLDGDSHHLDTTPSKNPSSKPDSPLEPRIDSITHIPMATVLHIPVDGTDIREEILEARERLYARFQPPETRPKESLASNRDLDQRIVALEMEIQRLKEENKSLGEKRDLSISSMRLELDKVIATVADISKRLSSASTENYVPYFNSPDLSRTGNRSVIKEGAKGKEIVYRCWLPEKVNPPYIFYPLGNRQATVTERPISIQVAKDDQNPKVIGTITGRIKVVAGVSVVHLDDLPSTIQLPAFIGGTILV